MKSPRIAIRLDEPCQQKWSEMTPSEKGRFCEGCRKNVVDVTSLTDNEMLQLVAENPQGFCGKFRPDQLSRTLVQTQLNGGGRRLNAFVAGIMIAVGAGTASAQSAPDTTVQTAVANQRQPITPKYVTALPEGEDLVITVYVYEDTIHGTPVPSASVNVNGTSITSVTDSTGKAVVIIPGKQRKDSIDLNISHGAYVSKFVALKPASSSETVQVVFDQLDIHVLGGAIYEVEEPVKPRKKNK